MAEKNIRLTIEYRGTAFSGWQYQDDARTIQNEIEEAIFKTTGKKVNLLAAGRTDAGVHALGQVANFRIDHNLDPQQYQDALNYYLDDDILIKNSLEVPLDFHARFDAISKRYRYIVSPLRSAIYRDLRWQIPAVEFPLLQQAAALVAGEHDFSPFCVVASRKEDNRCRIDYSRWFKYGELMVYEVRGNRFLHSMIRSLVGAMINLARVASDRNKDNLTLARFQNIIEAQTEDRVKFTAPARGLYLVSVQYQDKG